MKPTGIFERVRFLESRLDRLEVIILDQDAAIRRLGEEPGQAEPYREPGTQRLDDIAAMVAADNGLTLAEIRRPSRAFAVTRPRQFAMMLMRDAGHSQPAIARYFGMRCHTSVAYGIGAARERIRRLEEGRK